MSKSLKGIGNPNPFFASTILIGVFAALNLVFVFATFSLINGGGIPNLSEDYSYLFATFYFIAYLSLARATFKNKGYDIAELRVFRNRNYRNRFRLNLFFWGFFSIFSLPALGIVISLL